MPRPFLPTYHDTSAKAQRVQVISFLTEVEGSGFGLQAPLDIPLLLKLTEVPLLLRDVPLSTFVSVGRALKGSLTNLQVLEWRAVRFQSV